METIPKLDEFKKWAKEHHGLAMAVAMATAFAQCEKERVDAYIEPIFKSFNFTYSGDLAAKCNLTGPLPSQDQLYLCESPLLSDYFEKCDRAHREHGFTGPHGHCPALTAAHLETIAEHTLLKAGAKFFGIEDAPLYGENRKKMLNLLMGACLMKEGEKNVSR